jgi:hypothetical protein
MVSLSISPLAPICICANTICLMSKRTVLSIDMRS